MFWNNRIRICQTRLEWYYFNWTITTVRFFVRLPNLFFPSPIYVERNYILTSASSNVSAVTGTCVSDISVFCILSFDFACLFVAWDLRICILAFDFVCLFIAWDLSICILTFDFVCLFVAWDLRAAYGKVSVPGPCCISGVISVSRFLSLLLVAQVAWWLWTKCTKVSSATWTRVCKALMPGKGLNCSHDLLGNHCSQARTANAWRLDAAQAQPAIRSGQTLPWKIPEASSHSIVWGVERWCGWWPESPSHNGLNPRAKNGKRAEWPRNKPQSTGLHSLARFPDPRHTM